MNVPAKIKKNALVGQRKKKLNKAAQTTIRTNNLQLTISELQSLLTKLPTEESVPKELMTAASASFARIIAHLNKLKNIGINTTPGSMLQNAPTINDIYNIIKTGMIKNQPFIDSLCAILRVLPVKI